MKKIVIILLALFSLSLLMLPACRSGQVSAGLGQEFKLSIGQKAVISGEDLSLEFASVTEDSRCPTGAT